jgi:hypothetical protein
MQCKLDWFLHAPGALTHSPWTLAVVAWWLSSRSRRQAFWLWLTNEMFYKDFGFLGILWPQRQRKRVWPKVMEEAKLVYLKRLEKARQYRGDQLPKWWVAIANIRFLLHMAFADANKLLSKPLRNPKTHPELLADDRAKTALKPSDPAQGDHDTAKAQKRPKRRPNPEKEPF